MSVCILGLTNHFSPTSEFLLGIKIAAQNMIVWKILRPKFFRLGSNMLEWSIYLKGTHIRRGVERNKRGSHRSAAQRTDEEGGHVLEGLQLLCVLAEFVIVIELPFSLEELAHPPEGDRRGRAHERVTDEHHEAVHEALRTQHKLTYKRTNNQLERSRSDDRQSIREI